MEVAATDWRDKVTRLGRDAKPPVPFATEPGFYDDLPNEKYHSKTALAERKDPGLSKSGLVKLARSPRHFMTPTPPKRIFDLGTGAHTAILEPLKYRDESIFVPEGITLNSKAGKALKKQAEAEDKTVLTFADAEKIEGMAKSVMEHPVSSKLLLAPDGIAERSWYWKHPIYGILCKCRTDWYIPSNRVIADVKATTDARANPFSNRINDMRYDWQAPYYLDGVSIVAKKKHTLFAFIVVENMPPHGVNVFWAKSDMIERGRSQIGPIVNLYRECLIKDEWPLWGVRAYPALDDLTIDIPVYKQNS